MNRLNIFKTLKNNNYINALPPVFLIEALSRNAGGILNGADPNGSSEILLDVVGIVGVAVINDSGGVSNLIVPVIPAR